MEPQLGRPIRVLLVDDNPKFRQSTRVILTSEDIEVVGEADNGEKALEEVRRLTPNVVVMDCRMPRMDGAEATRQILRTHPETRVVALSIGDDSELLRRMERAGARPVVLKGAGPEELGQAIRLAFETSALSGQ
ncbi:MAG: two-component system, NarL family, invasion response regulator UvrY [Chloroflexota bacterium]|jgi:two-component system invasion response regulator UvrY|nr:two-component system, NarL family, invasion response regulator UvrY [Chloroflexota bacterium]